MKLANASTSVTITYASGDVLNLFKRSGATGSAEIESTTLDFGDPRIKKTPRLFLLWFEGINSVTSFVLTLLYRNSLKEDWTEYSKTFDVTENEQPIKVRPKAAKYWKIRFTDSAINRNWKLVRMRVEGTTSGKRDKTNG